jgi:hypothetical protein
MLTATLPAEPSTNTANRRQAGSAFTNAPVSAATTAGLRSAAAAADVGLAWLEAALDAEHSRLRVRAGRPRCSSGWPLESAGGH